MFAQAVRCGYQRCNRSGCCMLCPVHVCEIHGEEFSEEWLEGVESQESESGSAAAATPSQPQDSAVSIRDALMSHSTD